ncbi:MAG: YlxM family DNA-binding protein [Lachnospiraceae bacterium]
MTRQEELRHSIDLDVEKKVQQTYLYDFYGELLNPHQRSVYEAFVFQDLSLSEIAEEEGISRQGVHDLLKRCTKSLENYEEKLHLISRFLEIKEKVGEIHQLTHVCNEENQKQILQKIENLSNDILEEL